MTFAVDLSFSLDLRLILLPNERRGMKRYTRPSSRRRRRRRRREYPPQGKQKRVAARASAVCVQDVGREVWAAGESETPDERFFIFFSSRRTEKIERETRED